jgi:short-subunit dehydrogenase
MDAMAPTTILITGASGGLGAALARAHASPDAVLLLSGRDTDRLQAVAASCRARGAAVELYPIDLMDTAALAGRLAAIDRASPIDIAILNAGLGGETAAADVVEPATRALEVATVNFAATVVAATALAAPMAARRRGQIVLIGSVAAFFPLPMAPTYAASKAGLRSFAEGLGLRLERHGVAVTLIAPGFVDTAMSRVLKGPKPFMIDADEAARRIRALIARRVRHAVLPRRFLVIRALYLALPPALRRAVMRRVDA